MKKILAATLLCAVSSFATWDYFPIKDAGKGEAKVGVSYFMQDKWSAIGLNAGARFSVIEGLEVALLFRGHGEGFSGFPLTLSYDGESCDGDECPPTFAQPSIGLRYWLPAGVGIGLDVALPFQGEALGKSENANLVFTPAVQYSMKIGDAVELGSQISFSIPLESSEKYAPAKELGIGLELDFPLGTITPFVGVDVAMEIGSPSYDGNTDDDYEGSTGIAPYVGAIFKINDMLSADVGVAFGIGEDYYGEEMPIVIGANLSVNF